MGDGESASVALRVFAGQLKLFRELAELSREELGRKLGYAPHTIKAYELGQRIPGASTVEQADELLGARGVLKAAIPLLEEAQYPTFFRDVAKLERKCVRRCSYETLVVPGLLQTKDYARAVFESHVPALTDDEVERLVSGRLERQGLLTREDRPPVHFIVEQCALERPIGGWKVHREQMASILGRLRLRNVSLQVMPTNIEEHPCTDGPLVLLEMPDPRTLGYLEGHARSQLVSDRRRVAELVDRYAMIRTQALSTRESIQIIEKLAG
ncbi:MULTISPECIES: helix-turn-helix domain-containing protein [Streptomyces]|uniref:helix-turn-helix domain-containing protein n=1 Tax=Streptomyces TaxID=1883 RepID=UPI0019648101|nr:MULTISPECIES: helix-turn-helix transcriptional regulator [Streptomyces]QRX93807.1 helix-turn-helix transcriptional regulator [Streptomyces noursei]UJB43486.1 helix-turn-helix transcriptional regulator [Streptomyces sp. A1-5]